MKISIMKISNDHLSKILFNSLTNEGISKMGEGLGDGEEGEGIRKNNVVVTT